MGWAIASHPDHVQPLANGRLRLMVPPLLIPEDRLAAAMGQGWIVLGRDSDVEPPSDVNVQSNPRRLDEPRDYGEQ